MDLNFLLKKIAQLKVDRSKGAPAPHKAVLLLAVINGMELGEIRENKIFITAELVARFKDMWHELVHDERFVANFSLPFFHLKSSGLWKLHTYAGREILLSSSHSIKSFAALKDAVTYASLDEGLYALLMDTAQREAVKVALLDTYLGGQRLKGSCYDTLQVVENELLHEPASLYKLAVAEMDEEERFVRSGVFKKVVPKVYNYTCCISGMQVIATRDVQMIDACHIVPFAESHDDTIRNGLSLSPNFHRAFDRYLVSIDGNFRVVVSADFREAGAHSLRAFEGKEILLPREVEYRPGADNLRWHFERFLGERHIV